MKVNILLVNFAILPSPLGVNWNWSRKGERGCAEKIFNPTWTRECGGNGEGAAIEWLCAISLPLSHYNFQPIIRYFNLKPTALQKKKQLILVSIRRTRETGHMARGKICTITSRNISSWVCPVDFDGRREMSSLSLKTVVVHKSVTSLVMETNLRKGGLVHRVPYTKSREKLQELFQSVCVLFCKYKHCNLF